METLFRELIRRNYDVWLLTTCEAGDLHQQASHLGVQCHTHSLVKRNTFTYHWHQIRFLVAFCRQHRVDVVFSHLQQVNIIAVLTNFFLRAKVVIFRHHDYARNRKEKWADALINWLAPIIIVPSSGVQKRMLDTENVSSRKLSVIPYIYDFDSYQQPNAALTKRIREQHACQLLLIMVSRMVPQKRHPLAFAVVKKLVADGFDIKMLVMDTGYDEEKLRQAIQNDHLQNHVFMLGFQTNVIDYISAADALVHISTSEASCSAVKEAALSGKIVVACRHVGDFDDYLIDQKNGFLLDVAHTYEQLYQVLKRIYFEKNTMVELTHQAREAVLQRFSTSEQVMQQYDALIQKSPLVRG